MKTIRLIAFWTGLGLLVVLFILSATDRPFDRNRRERMGGLNRIGNNLRIIEGAKEQWALENKKKPDDRVTLSDLTAYFKDNRPPATVAGETYVVTTVETLARAEVKGEVSGHRGPFTTTSF